MLTSLADGSPLPSPTPEQFQRTKNQFNIRRVNYFSNRIANLWNNLPLSTTDFISSRRFNKSVSNDYLLVYCKLYFTSTRNNVLSTSVAITCAYAYM